MEVNVSLHEALLFVNVHAHLGEWRVGQRVTQQGGIVDMRFERPCLVDQLEIASM